MIIISLKETVITQPPMLTLLLKKHARGLHSLLWRHNGRGSVSNHQPHYCLLNRLFRRKSTKTSKLRVTGLCAGNSLGTGEFPAQRVRNTENVSIWLLGHSKAALMHSVIFRAFDSPCGISWLSRNVMAPRVFDNHKDIFGITTALGPFCNSFDALS